MISFKDVESVGYRALNSLKVRTAVTGAVVYILIQAFHIGSAQANAIANGVLQIVTVLIGAQGLADFGKESEKTVLSAADLKVSK